MFPVNFVKFLSTLFLIKTPLVAASAYLKRFSTGCTIKTPERRQDVIMVFLLVTLKSKH